MHSKMDELISTDALRALASAGVVEGAVVSAQAEGGYVLQVRAGESIRTLGSKRGGARKYAKLDTAATHLAALGIQRVEVDLQALRVRGPTLVTRGRQGRLAV